MAEDMPKNIGDFVLNHEHKFEIDTDSNKTLADIDKANFVPIAGGINNHTPAYNETASNDEYYDGEGWGSTDVTAKRLQLQFAGHRKQGDAGQDYVVSKQFAIGPDLKTLFRWTHPDGTVITGVINMSAIVPSGGAPGAKQTFSFNADFDGKPTVELPGKGDNGDGSGE